MTQEVAVSGMHCQACVQKVQKAIESVPGVASARVTLEPPRARFESDQSVEVADLAAAVQRAGSYSVTAVSGSSSSSGGESPPAGQPQGAQTSLYPLVLIVSFITGIALVRGLTAASWSWHTFMNDFMAGFFLAFSFFKLLDLRGFASAYRGYDLPARWVPGWAFAYPFFELALGVAYLTRWQPVLTNSVTLALMLVGTVGVAAALANKRKIRCACLGSVLNLPMTTVTLVEDLGMAAMAAAMLAWEL